MKTYIVAPSTNDFEQTLETLRRKGLVVRLAERRDGWPVYVLPEHVDGRPIDELFAPATLAGLADDYQRHQDAC